MDVCPEPISGSKQEREDQCVRRRVGQTLRKSDQAAMAAVLCNAGAHSVDLGGAWAYSPSGKIPASAAKDVFADLGDSYELELALPYG